MEARRAAYVEPDPVRSEKTLEFVLASGTGGGSNLDEPDSRTTVQQSPWMLNTRIPDDVDDACLGAKP
jgi:hypothetical protein